MVTYFYQENKKVTLTPDRRKAICTDINNKFKEYYKDLIPSFRETADILKNLYPDTSQDGKIKKTHNLYDQWRTYDSAIYQNCYADYTAMVDVNGQDLRSTQLSAVYKASLIYDWYNINLKDQIRKAAYDWEIKGEAAFYLCWKEDVYQTTEEVENEYVDELTGEVIKERIKVKQNVPTFQGIDVKAIDPHSLFFDKSQYEDWDNCRKVYRDFVPLEQILANTSYNLTPEEKKELKEMVKAENKTIEGINTSSLLCNENTKIRGNTVEVLEFEGTYTMPDSLDTLLRMEATVVAGKFLAKFQESDKPKSPYVWRAYINRPDTKRGQSPLKIPSILNDVQNMIMDLTMQCYLLTANPPYIAPQGAFTTSTKVKPGGVIYYDQNKVLERPQPLNFRDGLSGYNMISFLKDQAENATGISQYVQGANDGSVRTASEASYINSGASMRLRNESALFSRVIEELIRRYALYKKVFDTQDREVMVTPNVYSMVDKEVREGNYYFIIGGANSVVSREAEIQKMVQMMSLPVVQTLAQQVQPTQAAEFLKWMMNRLNLQGTDQLEQLLGMGQQIADYGTSQGIQDKNIPEFQRDVMNYIGGNVNNIAEKMINDKLNALNNKQ